MKLKRLIIGTWFFRKRKLENNTCGMEVNFESFDSISAITGDASVDIKRWTLGKRRTACR